jgi:hypothetical protein
VRDLVKAGVAVHAFNHRDLEGIYGMVQTVGGLVGTAEKATALVEELAAGVERIRGLGTALPCRPRVYFEEWDEPMICGIGWVSELIEIAGGEDVFCEKARSPRAGADRQRRRSRQSITGPDHRVMVREEVRSWPGHLTTRTRGGCSRSEQRCARDQVFAHPAARSSGTDIITGASGTTDIEGILVRGAHGPRNLHIVIAT